LTASQAVARAGPHRGKDVLFLAQPAEVQPFGLRSLADKVQHSVHCHPANQPAAAVRDGRCHKAIALKGLSRLLGLVVVVQHQHVCLHDVAHECFWIVDQQSIDRQCTLQRFAPVHHEQLVGVIRQLIQPAQIAQHDLQGDIVAHGDEIEIHQRAHCVVAVGHRCSELLALGRRQRLEDIVHDVFGQVGRKVRELVCVQLFGGSDQLLRLHVRDEGLAHRLGELQQDLALALGLDQIPHPEPPGQGQSLEDVGDISRVQPGELGLQLDHVLLVQQRFDQLAVRSSLLVDQVLHQLLLVEQLQDLVQRVLYALLALGLFDFGGF
jgi:hypothetical protein